MKKVDFKLEIEGTLFFGDVESGPTAYFEDTLTVGTNGSGTWGYGNNGAFGDFAIGDVAGSWPNGVSSWRRFYFSASGGQLRLNGGGIAGVDSLWVVVGDLDPMEFTTGTPGGNTFTTTLDNDQELADYLENTVGDGNTVSVSVYLSDPT